MFGVCLCFSRNQKWDESLTVQGRSVKEMTEGEITAVTGLSLMYSVRAAEVTASGEVGRSKVKEDRRERRK